MNNAGEDNETVYLEVFVSLARNLLSKWSPSFLDRIRSNARGKHLNNTLNTGQKSSVSSLHTSARC